MVLRGAAWACALVAGTLVIGGCTPDEPDPTPTTSVETSSSAPETSEPTVAVPELPKEAQAQTPEGAAAYALYWADVVSYAFTSGDTAALRALNDPACQECEGYASDIDQELAGGNRIEGGKLVLSNVVGGIVGADGVSIVSATFVNEASRTLDSTGNVVEETAVSEPVPFAFYCQWSEGGWKMRRLVTIQ